MSAFTGEPKRSDLRLVLRALKNNWQVEPQRLTEVEAFAIQARLIGRTDRLTSLAAEVLDAIHLHRLRQATAADSDLLESLMEAERQRDVSLMESGRLPTNHAETTHIGDGAGSGNPMNH